MARQAHLDPSGFFLEGSSTGILLIHGFTGSPPEMRLVGDYLHQRGLTVSAPLLPGHGTTPAEMNRCRWRDWTACVEQALTDLEARCQTVFVGGLSMGALLTLYLAVHRPEIRGIILYAPAVLIADRLIAFSGVAKYFIPYRPKSGPSDLTDPEAESRIWSYEVWPAFAAHELWKLNRYVRRHLSRVKCPTLIINSTGDTAIRPESAQYTLDRVGATDKELFTLHNSGHVLTVDSEWETVAEKSYQFIRAHS